MNSVRSINQSWETPVRQRLLHNTPSLAVCIPTAEHEQIDVEEKPPAISRHAHFPPELENLHNQLLMFCDCLIQPELPANVPWPFCE